LASYQKLEGGPKQTNSINHGFNHPRRKELRNLLYDDLVDCLKRKREMFPYDRYVVTQVVLRKIREGKL